MLRRRSAWRLATKGYDDRQRKDRDGQQESGRYRVETKIAGGHDGSGKSEERQVRIRTMDAGFIWIEHKLAPLITATVPCQPVRAMNSILDALQ